MVWACFSPTGPELLTKWSTVKVMSSVWNAFALTVKGTIFIDRWVKKSLFVINVFKNITPYFRSLRLNLYQKLNISNEIVKHFLFRFLVTLPFVDRTRVGVYGQVRLSDSELNESACSLFGNVCRRIFKWNSYRRLVCSFIFVCCQLPCNNY